MDRRQPLPRLGSVSVTEALIQLIREREQAGIATYSRSLETFNGRDALQDALEEAIDLTQYLLQLRLEWLELRAKVDDLRNSGELLASLIRSHPIGYWVGDEANRASTALDIWSGVTLSKGG